VKLNFFTKWGINQAFGSIMGRDMIGYLERGNLEKAGMVFMAWCRMQMEKSKK
jgi:hypothetical protein